MRDEGIFELEAYQTTTGHTLTGVKLNYVTHGTLNEAKDNAILFPHFLGGSPALLEGWIGEGRAIDPDNYFVILPGQFGNGVSTSSSNAAAPYNAGGFPEVRIADDVIVQHKLVTEHFGISELQLVFGWSTGALQTYEWAVRFGDVVKRIASIAGAPKPSPWTDLWLYTVIEEPLVSHPAYNDGFYADPSEMQSGLRRVGHGAALTLPPGAFYREGEELWRGLGLASRDDFVSLFWEGYWLPQDPNDLITQVHKARNADPSAGGDLAAALASIKAKTSVVAFTGDPMFQPDECRKDAERIPGATFQKVESPFGHLATFALSPDDQQAIDDALSAILSR